MGILSAIEIFRQPGSVREIAGCQNVAYNFRRDTILGGSVVASGHYQPDKSWFLRGFLKGREDQGPNRGLFQ